ncbi:MAG: transposase [Candidatus Bathyarchaeia archaeon]
MRWRDPRPGRFKRRDWLKLHAAVTSILKAIPSMEVTDGEASDSPQLKKLLDSLPLEDVEAVAADSAYLSRENCDLIEAIGAKPYIKPKRNSTARSHGSRAWRNMILNHRENPEEWNKRYHIRSSAETAFSVIKRRFGYQLSSIRKDLQRKELMTKVIAYNLNILAKTII